MSNTPTRSSAEVVAIEVIYLHVTDYVVSSQVPNRQPPRKQLPGKNLPSVSSFWTNHRKPRQANVEIALIVIKDKDCAQKAYLNFVELMSFATSSSTTMRFLYNQRLRKVGLRREEPHKEGRSSTHFVSE